MTLLLGRRNLLILLIGLLCVAFLLAQIMGSIYETNREILMLRGESRNTELVDNFSLFLLPNIDVMKSSAFVVDHVLGVPGRDPAGELKRFLTEQTQIFSKTIDGTFSGLYGYFDGVYVDGTDWVPDEDFNPVERPWYLEAVKTPGKMTFVEPYLDAMTGSILMTISRTVGDGSSVLAVDLSLDKIQKMVEDASGNARGTHMILNSEGLVMSHTDRKEVGKIYTCSGEDLYRAAFCKLETLLRSERLFSGELSWDGTDYVFYAQPAVGDWYVITLVKADTVFGSTHLLLAAFILSGVGILLVIALTFLRMTSKQIRIETLNRNLETVARIYDHLVEIDLETDTLRVITSTLHARGSAEGSTSANARNVFRSRLDSVTDGVSRETVRQFADFSTLATRFEGNSVLTLEFLSDKGLWSRARFVAPEQRKDGKLKTVLFLVENIDNEKRERDKLIHLSETDPLTGISNRRSGESRMRQLISSREQGGMFALIDADDFKSVNDTFGHEIGDKVIVAIADSLRGTFGSRDVVMRLGGDEFAVYAPASAGREIAGELMGRFFDRLLSVEIPEMKGRRICVSAGVAMRGCDGGTFEELYRSADTAVYRSKKNHGNSYTFAS